MNSEQMENWLVERVGRSSANLVQAVMEEVKLEMMGLPLEMRQVIHVRAIFELLRMVNASGDRPDESDTHYDAFMEFICREYKGFVEMCLRMQRWKPETSAEGTKDKSTLQFRKNASRN